MPRRVIAGAVAVALLAGAAAGTYWAYDRYFRGSERPVDPVFTDHGKALAKSDEFEELAKSDPVGMLAQCLSRYQREVKGGIQATLQKQERVQGKPKPPEAPPVEVIDLFVRGDVPDPQTQKTEIEVVMKWRSGARKALGIGAEIRGTLFSEKPAPEGLGGKVVTWRPEASFGAMSGPLPANSDLAKTQSRYCIRDAGLYRGMLRTHTAWKARKEAGTLKTEYLGRVKLEPAGGRECYAVKRLCPQPEVDAFEIGGTPDLDPKAVAAEGFTEVTIYIDAERWLQIGSELYRTEPDGTRVLIGAYYFRDLNLDPTFPPDAFTRDGLKR
jgi:hypothetical protein